MPQIFYMFERELIEHKMITRIPLFLLICGALFFIGILLPGFQGNIEYQFEVNGNFNPINIGDNVSSAISYIIGLVSLLLTSLYIPKTLRKERQEGSSMFWRSMPISYTMSIFVKLIFALLVIPIICSSIILISDILLWVTNMIYSGELIPFINNSLLDVVINWVTFLAHMLIAAIAILPLACMVLMVSQLVSSPLLVIIIMSYAIKWLSIYLFGFYGISEFISIVLSLPIKALSMTPFSGFSEAGIINLILYYGLGILALIANIKLYKTKDASFSTLYK